MLTNKDNVFWISHLFHLHSSLITHPPNGQFIPYTFLEMFPFQQMFNKDFIKHYMH